MERTLVRNSGGLVLGMLGRGEVLGRSRGGPDSWFSSGVPEFPEP